MLLRLHKKMSEKDIWNEIEFFLSSNPIYIRRVQALETRIIKGETVSDFYNRLKNSFREAEMEKASMATIMIGKLIASLIERITKARAATVGASPTEEAVAPVEEIVVIEETEAFVE